MKCPKCQFDNRESAKFCLKCGAKFELKCPKCNRSLPFEAIFCDECGHDLREPQKPFVIDYSKPQSYTPKHLADKILTTRSALEGERKIVTVLFADVANYTAMSEKLDPEEVLQIMDGAFKIMMDETHKYEGTINQFTGDGIMAIFGAPVAHENHAQRACYTALTIQNAMLDYSERIKKKYGADFKIRIGINSGAVIVSAIGDDLRMDYTAVGDTTNLASRMESLAKTGTIFVSANTHKIVERYFEFDFKGKTEVKGKEEPQDIYELLKASEVVTRIDESVAKGLTRFVGRKNSMAALMESYDRVKSGLGQVVGIVGEAGVGKSRLILEFRNCIASESHTWLEGQCLQYGGTILYKPILDILKSFFDVKDNDREFIIKKKIEDKILSIGSLIKTDPVIPAKAGHEVKHSAIQQKYGMRDQEQPGFRIRSGMTDEGKPGMTQPVIPAKAGHEVKYSAIQQKYGMTDGDKPGFPIKTGMTDENKTGFRIRSGMTDEGKPGMTDEGKQEVTQPVIPEEAEIQIKAVIPAKAEIQIKAVIPEEAEILIKTVIPAKAGIQTDSVIAGFSLEQTIPAFQDLLSVSVEDKAFLKLEPKQKREKAFESIRDLLISVSQEKPLIMVVEDLHWIDDVVEDLHWIDDTSEQFLDYLIEWIANTQIMLVLLYRTEYQHKWSSKTYYHKIGLDHLGKESAVELVKAMLEDGDVAAELRDLILARAAGNPLFMEEFTQSLVENGAIQKRDNQYILSRKITEIHVPDTVQGIIAARMDRLEENLKRTMQVASVIGRDFAFRILQTITGMREELKSYLLNLQGLEFIYEKRLFPELEYIFKHALTQEVAYNSLLLKRRKQIHENIGKAIEELYSERLEEFYEMLAYHYSKSDNLEKACHYFKLSGIKASKNYANQEAFNFFKEALDLLSRFPDIEEIKKKKIEIGMSMHGPMNHLGYPLESLDILKNGEKLSREIGDKKSLAAFYGYISRYYTYRGNPLEGIKFVEPRYDEAKKNLEIDLMTPLSIGLCGAYQERGYYTKASDLIPDLIGLLEKTGRKRDYFDMPFNVYSWLCNTLSLSFLFTGYFEKAIYYLEKGLGLTVENNDKFNMGDYHAYYCHVYQFKGLGKKIIEHSQKGLMCYKEINARFSIAGSQFFLGWGYYLLGELDAARKFLETGYAMQMEISVNYAIFMYPWVLGQVHLDSGDMNAAQKYGREALEFSIKGNSLYAEGLSRIWLGRILGKNKVKINEESENNISQGITILKELKLRPWVSYGYFYLGELYSEMGEFEKSLGCLKKAEAEFQDMGMDYWLSFSKSLIGKTLSKISPSQFHLAEQTIFDAIKIAQDIESKPALAHGRLCLGEIYADNGQKEKALENLKKAEAMYQEMKMGLWLGKTREVLDRIA